MIALGLVAVAAPVWEFIQRLRQSSGIGLAEGAELAAMAVLLISAQMLWSAGYDAIWMTVPAMHDAYRWHYQMGTFLRRFYQGSALVVDDVGMVDYMADIHLSDPHGLADREIGAARLFDGGKLDPGFLDQVARSRGATVALVDEDWTELSDGMLQSEVPRTWLLAGVWKHHNRVALAPPGLSLNETARTTLIRNLKEYSPRLPDDVEQSGPHTHGTNQGTGL